MAALLVRADSAGGCDDARFRQGSADGLKQASLRVRSLTPSLQENIFISKTIICFFLRLLNSKSFFFAINTFKFKLNLVFTQRHNFFRGHKVHTQTHFKTYLNSSSMKLYFSKLMNSMSFIQPWNPGVRRRRISPSLSATSTFEPIADRGEPVCVCQ